MTQKTVFVDADACPVTRDAIAVARAHGAGVVLVGNESQNLSKHGNRLGVETIQVAAGRDAADFVIVGELEPQDVVVTADIGLAAMVLGRGAKAVSPRGHVFLLATIDAEMAVRHAEQVERRRGKRVRGGPSPFEDDDRERFSDVLARLLRQE